MDPGDGRHQPCVMRSISSTISAPFLAARASMERVHMRRPRRPCIFQPKGHMGIDKPILDYRYINLCGACPRASPREAQVARGPDPVPAVRGLESEDARLGVIKIV